MPPACYAQEPRQPALFQRFLEVSGLFHGFPVPTRPRTYAVSVRRTTPGNPIHFPWSSAERSLLQRGTTPALYAVAGRGATSSGQQPAAKTPVLARLPSGPAPVVQRSLRSLTRRQSPRSVPEGVVMRPFLEDSSHVATHTTKTTFIEAANPTNHPTVVVHLPQRRITLPSGNSGACRLIPPCATPPGVGALVGLRSARSSHELRPPR